MIIVTGATGFIGSNLVAHLNQLGHTDIVIVDWLGTGEKWKNIAKHRFVEFVFPQDFPAFLEKSSGAVEAVFHLGAISSTTATDGDEVVSNNIQFSMNLWNWCAARQVPFFYASSAATYGDGDQGFDDTQDIAPLRPLNLYGWSKQAFDRWALGQAEKGAAPPRWAGFKFFNVYGPNEYHKADMMSIVAKNHSRVMAKEPIHLFKSHRPDFKDGEQLRDFVYVKDCCKVMSWFMADARQNGVYNLGTGSARSFRDLIEAVGTACGIKPDIQYVPMPENLRGKYQYFTQAAMQKLRAAGYDEGFYSLEEGVADYVQSYLNTPDKFA
ncbi:ADP-glyceromanno-heptose 6-epimerase precursor [Variovorax sp. YR752]|uniref:ADP-glyceromanno-heptose 6-epimerase n=1 Tax=Variovorax sp. YR752 TaxID=1884383 RepID=UPI000BC483FE|nr:ADP-glyceromanno-heptose 6-epimerase [Variovorax sp. YR752]SOD30468.1 ADP-glyceromanno-heptose 6-epimerase precursor [Variovorax sp. YR752]